MLLLSAVQLLCLLGNLEVLAFVDLTARQDSYADFDGVAAVSLGQDPESGCLCSEQPGVLVICYGGNVCKRFPKSVDIPTSMLRVKATNIRSILVGDLRLRMRHLRYLEIEANHNMNYIEPGSFYNMTNLQYLSLSYNSKITHLEETTFLGLDNLSYLKLIKNGFQVLSSITPAMSPRYLPALERLDLSENYLSNITKNDIKPLEGSILIELNLVLCQLEYIHPNSFIYLQNLSELRIGENNLNSSIIANLLRQSIIYELPLRTVNLFAMGFRKPPDDILNILSHSHVSQLVLAKNQFEFLPENSFPHLPYLKFLDLRQVLAVGLHERALGIKNFPQLETLLLGNNKFNKIPRGALLPQLTNLDLSANSETEPLLGYFDLEERVFENMSKLITLNLSFNKVMALYNTTFVGLSQLKVLSLKNCTIFYIDIGTFKPLFNLEFLNLQNNFFPIIKNISKEQFSGLDNLKVLLLSSCSIKSFNIIPDFFSVFPNLTRICLKNNELTVLPRDLFKDLTHLEAIDLSGNNIFTWKDSIFSIYNINLFKLYLTGNKITHISEGMLKDFNLVLSSKSNETDLRIDSNPYACDCDFFYDVENFIRVQNATEVDEFLANSLAVCATPDDWADKTIAEYWSTFYANAKCPHFTSEHAHVKYSKVITILPIVTSLIIFLTVCSLVINYRCYITYWLFLVKMGLINTRKSLFAKRHGKNDNANYKYDAFVSYSNEDADFVTDLVDALENSETKLKLCVYERDFEIGAIISEAILQSITLSRHVILIVSDNFARSQWCRWEAQMAENHKLFFGDSSKRDSLILIKIGHVSKELLSPTLKYLLRTRVYLQWHSDKSKVEKFWTKLKRTLQNP